MEYNKINGDINGTDQYYAEIEPTKINLRENVRFDDNVAELQETIKRNGLIEPLFCIEDLEHRGEFILVAGCSRFRAMYNLNYLKVPCIVRRINFRSNKERDAWCNRMQLIENTARYSADSRLQGKRFKEEIENEGLNISELSSITGLSEGRIRREIRIYEQNPDLVKLAITRGADGRIKRQGKIFATLLQKLSTKYIINLPEEQRNELKEYVRTHEISEHKLRLIAQLIKSFNMSVPEAIKESEKVVVRSFALFVVKEEEEKALKELNSNITNNSDLFNTHKMIIQIVQGKLPPNSKLLYNASDKGKRFW